MALAQRGTTFPELVDIMKRLLAPDGCPWDREQTLQTLEPYLIEEAYEVLEAIDAGDAEGHCDELGDLLFQIVFQAELRAVEGKFGIDDVVSAIATKMKRRHPHVFGDVTVKDSNEVLANWGKLKAEEHKEKGIKRRALGGVPVALPALLRAQRIGEKAAAVGFDWPDIQGVREKVLEELGEIDEAVASGDPAQIEHEVGDLLLAASRLSAKLGVAPEDALRSALRRFQSRFEAMEDQVVAAGGEVAKTPLEELDRIWNLVKKAEPVVPKK
ncbi:MAG: nucleoside triphosphate pyrophosphohydrolase [Myxococcales bacterium]|nr:nucleoside triphosphate pyrophosphohydrolase [Myxococcales bacterium]